MQPRPRLRLSQELILALLPTAVVLLTLGLVESVSRQRFLFASLASSAFLIYLEPDHPANTVRTVVLAQGAAAVLGFGAYSLLGAGYLAAGVAMVLTIVLTIAMKAMHPPAVATSLTFAYRANPASSLSLFGISIAIIVLLVLLQRTSTWLVRRYATMASAS